MNPNNHLYSFPDTLNEQFAGYQSMEQLAKFASYMVYVMWHGRRMINRTSSGEYMNSFSQSNRSFYSFQRFCLYIFKTMSIHDSAIYLCLKYVALLLQMNPTMEGSEGSEYRIFVVSLLLACKFLDDITFVNTTWSDVSGMRLSSLNVMEAEFMEGINYRLFVRSQDFNQWKTLMDECRDRLFYYGLQTPAFEQEKTILSILYTIGLQPMPPRVSVATRVVEQAVPLPAVAVSTGVTGFVYTCEHIGCNDIEAANIRQHQYAYNQYRHFLQSL